ncbi:MAG: DUF2855 family protein [Bradyrhizobium sp.]
MTEQTRDFLVHQDDLTRTKWVSTPLPELRDGEILLRIDRFGFTANNVTYATRGANFFWKFFPAPAGWFRVPVWGFAVVAKSLHPGVSTGERVYGYLPMSTFLVIQADQVTPTGFNDAAAHRTRLPAMYNLYHRTAADPTYSIERESAQALLRPLFRTSFVIDDYLGDKAFFGARRVILGSASSKTALGLAFILSKKRKPAIEIVGLSSRRNLPFLNDLGYYDKVVSYDDVHSLSIDQLTAYVDMSGDAAVREALHKRLGDTLCFDCRVGSTHWTGMDDRPVSGVQPTMFSMAEQMKKRLSEWGPGEFQRRYLQDWRAFLQSADGWLKPIEGHGELVVTEVYQQMMAGKSSPAHGHLLSIAAELWE